VDILHYNFSFKAAILVFFSAYFVIAFLENSIDFSKSIFYCSRGEDATGASLPPFLAPFLSSFLNYK